jgi:hypothetical protein
VLNITNLPRKIFIINFILYRFNLMQKCWSFSAEERPCFAYLLQELEAFQEKCAQMTPEEIALHSPTGADGKT